MAQAASESIVSFARPPVVEVVVGVAFDGLGTDAGALLAAFWKEHLRQQFPSLQQQPPYSPPDEHYAPDAGTGALNFSLTAGMPTVRLWAQSRDGQELLQLQPGWFACNWRKVQPAAEYGRWRSRREAFQRYFNALSDYMATEGAGQPKVRLCEVTYINHIPASATWSTHADYSKIFTMPGQPDTPYPAEQMSCHAQFVLAAEGHEPHGRLYTKIFPAFGADGKIPLYVLELTARGAPQGEGADGALAFLDLGREAIDRTFLALTTETMHDEWGFQP